jgi:hypothetical protein
MIVEKVSGSHEKPGFCPRENPFGSPGGGKRQPVRILKKTAEPPATKTVYNAAGRPTLGRAPFLSVLSQRCTEHWEVVMRTSFAVLTDTPLAGTSAPCRGDEVLRETCQDNVRPYPCLSSSQLGQWPKGRCMQGLLGIGLRLRGPWRNAGRHRRNSLPKGPLRTVALA